MATGQAKLAGRFPPGTIVALVEVAGEHSLRAEGGKTIDRKKVDKDGTVTFSKGVKDGGRYFITGLVNGFPVEARMTGRSSADDSAVTAQAPIGPDRQKLSDGSFLDEPPEPHQDAGKALLTSLGQHQVPKGTVQRSDTPRGTAHPVDTDDQEPVRRQEDVNGPVQMSDTETGEATEIVLGPQRQEDVPKGVLQRSSTPTGVAVPIPAGDPVGAQRLQESSLARESRGDRTRAAAEPLDGKGLKVGAPTGASKKESEERDAELKKSEREAAALATFTEPQSAGVDTSGRDAQGQPAAEDVAHAAGVEPASKPSEPVSRRSRRKARKQSSKSTTANKTKE